MMELIDKLGAFILLFEYNVKDPFPVFELKLKILLCY